MEHIEVHGQVGEESFDLRAPHVFGVPLAVKEDETFDPGDVGFLGADGVMLAADRVSDLIEELLRSFARCWLHCKPALVGC